MLIKLSLIGDLKAGMIGLLVKSDQNVDLLIQNQTLLSTVVIHILIIIKSQEK